MRVECFLWCQILRTKISDTSRTKHELLLWQGAEGVEKESKLQAADILAAESSERVVSTYDCPVCRKAQILDLDRLQVSMASSM